MKGRAKFARISSAARSIKIVPNDPYVLPDSRPLFYRFASRNWKASIDKEKTSTKERLIEIIIPVQQGNTGVTGFSRTVRSLGCCAQSFFLSSFVGDRPRPVQGRSSALLVGAVQKFIPDN